MSRIGKIPLSIPKEVKLAVSPSTVQVEGPKGKLSLSVPYRIKVECKDNVVTVLRNADSKQNRANHGSVRALLENMVVGVTKGHRKDLEIQGVGFRAQLNGDNLTLNLGFSHSVDYKVPKTVKVTVVKPTEIVVEGPDRCAVGQVASDIRAFKLPEPYKGKGVRYSGEVVRRKQGKSVTK